MGKYEHGDCDGCVELRRLLAEKDMAWWEKICLVDNVAPNPDAVKKWLLTLSTYEQRRAHAEGRKAGIEEAAKMASELPIPQSSSLSPQDYDTMDKWGADIAQAIRNLKESKQKEK